MTEQTNWAKVLGELLADHELSCNRQVTNCVAETITPLVTRLAQIEARPIERGEKGPQGDPGPQGPPGHVGHVSPELAMKIAAAARMLHESPALS